MGTLLPIPNILSSTDDNNKDEPANDIPGPVAVVASTPWEDVAQGGEVAVKEKVSDSSSLCDPSGAFFFLFSLLHFSLILLVIIIGCY